MTDFDKTLFDISVAGGIPAIGAQLVAEPFLREEYFSHAVITLIDYEPAGSAMGIVMNRKTSLTLQSVLGGITAREPVVVYCGGPLSCDRLFFIHTLGQEIFPGAKEIVKDSLYVGGDFDTMKDYVNAGYPIEGKLRCFIGYSGWGPGQLDEELRNKVWAVRAIEDCELLLTGSDDAYWHRTIRSMGKKFRGWLYHPQNLHAN